MVEKNGTLSKKSRLGEAFSYVLNQWDALCYYSDDGLAEGDADDFLDCFIIPARIVGGTFWG
ncbi:putative transposase [Escherichia coli 2-210-07_S3_C2]|nr:transposase [Escherichia coli TW10509]KDW91512.1 putative transposase [Escherichia coli 2-210-07_S3_C2]